MSDVLKFFGVLPSPQLGQLQIDPDSGLITLNWTASAGLTYRVQFKTNLSDSIWQTLGTDVTATNTIAFKVDGSASGASQRFYRILLLN